MNFFVVLSICIFLSACSALTSQPTDAQSEIKKLQAEVQKLKETQALIAQRIGLGELVRPDKIIWGEGWSIGNDQSPVVMIEFTDLQCPFCKRFQQEVWPEIKAKYVDTGLVQFVGKELPLVKIHKSAGYAAVALRCAAQQDRYEQAKELLFAVGTGFNQEFVDALPESLEIDSEGFKLCLKDMSQHNAVSASVALAHRLGLQSTPVFIIGQRQGEGLINYEVLTGAGSVERFSELFDGLLK